MKHPKKLFSDRFLRGDFAGDEKTVCTLSSAAAHERPGVGPRKTRSATHANVYCSKSCRKFWLSMNLEAVEPLDRRPPSPSPHLPRLHCAISLEAAGRSKHVDWQLKTAMIWRINSVNPTPVLQGSISRASFCDQLTAYRKFLEPLSKLGNSRVIIKLHKAHRMAIRGDGGSSKWRPPSKCQMGDGGSSKWRPPSKTPMGDGGSSKWRPPSKRQMAWEDN
uniref:Predicted protein n=1 Tax=Physcomitrium patens TaxID=3218 RepID=A9U494_PHYPA